MMYYVLIGLAALGVLVIAVVLLVALQSDQFEVSRQTKIAARAGSVFEHVNDFRKWEHWSPWAKIDPAMKQTYEGPELGAGAMYSWVGNDQVGEGKMTILDSRPGEVVKIKLEFVKPFAATNTAEFTFHPEGDHTLVTWKMYGDQNFMLKALHLFRVLDMDRMVGPDFEKGLASMKAIAEGKA